MTLFQSRDQRIGRPLKNSGLLRQRKKPDRLCMRDALCILAFFAFLPLTVFLKA